MVENRKLFISRTVIENLTKTYHSRIKWQNNGKRFSNVLRRLAEKCDSDSLKHRSHMNPGMIQL